MLTTGRGPSRILAALVRRKTRLTVLGFSILGLCAPAGAGAATTVSYFAPGQSSPPEGLRFGLNIQGDGASNDINMRGLENPFRFRVAAFNPDFSFAPMVAGEGCAIVSSAVECVERGSFAVFALLGDGSDELSENTFPDVPIFGILDVEGGDASDELVGGRGDDRLSGGSGADTLAGRRGVDRLIGGSGADTLDTNDGVADARADCGADFGFPGGNDVAVIDLADPHPNFVVSGGLVRPVNGGPANCETVMRQPVGQKPVAVLTRARSGRGVVLVRARCTRPGGCRGTLRVTTARQRAISAARRFRLARGRSGTFRIPLDVRSARRGASVVARGRDSRGRPLTSSVAVRPRRAGR